MLLWLLQRGLLYCPLTSHASICSAARTNFPLSDYAAELAAYDAAVAEGKLPTLPQGL
jgi:hypothetical protein